jgi:hypothetical protein
MKHHAIAAMALLMVLAGDVRADIYRWQDDAGTIHFTDDLSNVPAAYRGKAKLVIREGPRLPEPPPAAPADPGGGQPPSVPAPPPSPEDPAAAAAREKEALAAQVEQLKAKIAAKEQLVRTVEERQNLALNPLRSRVLDPGDLDLYKKYQEELPEDRQTLQELESRLDVLK